MGIWNAGTIDEIFQIYEKLATHLAETNDRELSFEETVYSYFQSFNPTRRLSRSEIPFNEIKDFIESLTVSKKRKFVYDFPSAPNSPDAKESLTKNVSFFHHDFFSDAFNKMPHAQSNADNITMKVDRRTALYKRSRKVNVRKREFIALDCHESELLDSFEQLLSEVLASRNSSIDCCNIIVNSLAMFFSQNTWSSRVQDNVVDFLQNFVVASSAELCGDCYLDFDEQVNSEKMLLKIQVMCLLELFSAKLVNYPIEKLRVIEKLHLLRYAFGKDELYKFINEALQQEFGQTLPDHISKICEALKTPIIKKKRKLSNGDLRFTANETGDDSESRLFKKRNSPTKSGRKTLSDSFKKQSIINSKFEDLDDDNSSTSYSNETILREKKFPSVTDFSGISYTPKLSIKMEIDSGSASPAIVSSRRNSRTIPPIAAATNISSRKSSITNFVGKVPVANCFARKKNYVPCYRRIDSSSEEEAHLEDIPEIAEIEKSTLKVARTLKTLPVTKISHRSSQKGRMSKNACARSMPLKKCAPDRIKRRPSSSVKLMDGVSKKSEQYPPLVLSQRNISTASSALSADSSRNATYILNNSTMAHYKKRMEVIKSNARSLKFNNQELFYGRCHARQGLFDEEGEAAQKSGSSSEKNTSSKQNQTSNGNGTNGSMSAAANCGQKNRSGRVINAPKSSAVDDCVHIAHTLLNVHNSQPLAPFKARQVIAEGSGSSPVGNGSIGGFRVRKFVKPANRSERRRMEKFKKSANVIGQTQTNNDNNKGTSNS